MKKSIALASIVVFSFSFFGCDKKETETAIPTSEVTMERTMTYQDNQQEDKALYAPGILHSTAVLENEELTIGFYSYDPEVKDEIGFKIRQANLLNGYVGEYSLKSLPDPDAGLAKVTYVYHTSGSSGSIFFSQANTLSGKFSISAYDAATKLASGSYELRLPDINDPTINTPNQADIRKCDILVKGSFKNVKLQDAM